MVSQRSESDQPPENTRANMRRAHEAKRRSSPIADRDDRPHETSYRRGDRRHLHAKLRELQVSNEDDWQDYEG